MSQMINNIGTAVSRIVFGSLVISPLQAALSPERGGELISYAYERGINAVDTAQYYDNYEHIRCALKKHPELIVSSKTYAYTKQLAVDAVEGARRALDKDVIDIFMLHEQESEHTVRGHMEALEYLHECKAKGIIKAVGISTHFIAGVRAAKREYFDLLHPIINYKGIGIVDGEICEMESAVKDAYERGLFVLGMKALGGGNLHSTADEALNYALSLPYVNSIALGMQSEEEIDANLFFLKNGYFTDDMKEWQKERVKRLLIEDYCTACGECVKRCKGKALYIADNICKVDNEKCVLCGYCSKACGEMAIKIY